MDSILKVVGVIVLFILVVLAMGFPTMWCWNYLMPRLFDLPQINFFDAIVIQIMCQLMFKNSISSK